MSELKWLILVDGVNKETFFRPTDATIKELSEKYDIDLFAKLDEVKDRAEPYVNIAVDIRQHGQLTMVPPSEEDFMDTLHKIVTERYLEYTKQEVVPVIEIFKDGKRVYPKPEQEDVISDTDNASETDEIEGRWSDPFVD